MESDNCSRNSNLFNFGANIYVHMVFLFTILSGLFIFAISKIISNSINDEITHLVNNNITDYYNNLNAQDKDNVNTVLKITPLELLSKYYSQDEKVRETNNKQLFKSLYMFITIFIIIFIVIYLSAKILCHPLPLKRILIENVVIFAGVGVVEFLFFYFIILKYIPTKPSFIITYILDTIKNKLGMN